MLRSVLRGLFRASQTWQTSDFLDRGVQNHTSDRLNKSSEKLPQIEPFGEPLAQVCLLLGYLENTKKLTQKNLKTYEWAVTFHERKSGNSKANLSEVLAFVKLCLQITKWNLRSAR